MNLVIVSDINRNNETDYSECIAWKCIVPLSLENVTTRIQWTLCINCKGHYEAKYKRIRKN